MTVMARPWSCVSSQANALRLKHEVQEREAAVDRAYLRLQAGQPPDEAIEQQWQQLLREEQQRKEACLRKVMGNVLSTLHVPANNYDCL